LSGDAVNGTSHEAIYISAKTGEGIKQLYKSLLEMFEINEIDFDNENIVTNVRHKNLIVQAIENLEKAEDAIKIGIPADIITINIKEIIEALSKITGEDVSEDLLTEIFSKFCLGK